MARQTIGQASCTNCGEDDDNFTQVKSQLFDEGQGVEYNTRCECGETGYVEIDETGISESENLSFDEASWNNE